MSQLKISLCSFIHCSSLNLRFYFLLLKILEKRTKNLLYRTFIFSLSLLGPHLNLHFTTKSRPKVCNRSNTIVAKAVIKLGVNRAVAPSTNIWCPAAGCWLYIISYSMMTYYTTYWTILYLYSSCIHISYCMLFAIMPTGLKGTVARDFWPPFFFVNQPHMGRWFMPQNILISILNSPRYSNSNVVPRGIIPRRTKNHF